MTATSHIVAHDGTQKPFGFECLHCGATLPLSMPLAVDAFCGAADAFLVQHRDCKKPEATP